jgi:hypothetical protein
MRQEVRELKKQNALAGRVFRFLYEQKAARKDPLKQRDLQLRFTKRISELEPVLKGMAQDRVIIWDRKKKTVTLNGYNPRDRRKFIWLVDSSWPRSPFEPYLQKGKTYRARDFRSYVVEEWVKTKAAKVLS